MRDSNGLIPADETALYVLVNPSCYYYKFGCTLRGAAVRSFETIMFETILLGTLYSTKLSQGLLPALY